MPADTTITAFYHFTSGTIYTSEVNNNFDVFRGDLCSVDPFDQILGNRDFNLGSFDHAWLSLYAENVMLFAETATANPDVGFYKLWQKTDGNIYQVDNSGTSRALLFTNNTLTVSNKDIDGGTASNASRITMPKAAKSALDALARKAGTIVYATDENKFYGDNGAALAGIGGGSWATSSQTLASGANISLTANEINQMIVVTGDTTTGSTLSSTPFGNSAPSDGTFVRMIGGSNAKPAYIVYADSTYGAIGNFSSLELSYGINKGFQYSSILQRWIYSE